MLQYLGRIANEDIRAVMDARQTVSEFIMRKGLKWFEHLLRMPDDRWRKRMFLWKPREDRKRQRLRRS